MKSRERRWLLPSTDVKDKLLQRTSSIKNKFMFIMQKSLTVDVAIWLFSSVIKKRVKASYLAVGPAPPTVSLKAVRPWTDCRAIPSLPGAQPAQRCRLYQKLPYTARSSFKAVPWEAASQDCACVREASVSTKSGPGRHRAADLAVIVTSRSSERSLPGKTVLLVDISTASAWCLHTSTNYDFPKHLAALTSELD